MSDLIVLAFDIETGAQEMRETLVQLQKQKIVTLKNFDATVIQTSLSEEDDARLREYFGAEEIET